MGVRRIDRSGRMLMLALGVLNPLASSALLTGGLASMTASALLGGFSWLNWFALMAAPYYALLFGGALLLRAIVGPFERGDICGGLHHRVVHYAQSEIGEYFRRADSQHNLFSPFLETRKEETCS
jgi:hypothetical protein